MLLNYHTHHVGMSVFVLPFLGTTKLNKLKNQFGAKFNFSLISFRAGELPGARRGEV